MKLETMGTDFGHKPQEFSPRIIRQTTYSICSFDTDFVYEYNGNLLEGNKGEILINEPNRYLYHGPRKNAKTGYINDWMHITGEDFGELLKHYPLPLNKPFKISPSFYAKKYFKKIENEFINEQKGYNDIIKSLVTQLIINLYRDYTCNIVKPVKSENYRITMIYNEICKDPQRKWQLKELAEKSGYSVSRFCEIYKSIYSESPIQTVNKERINMAKKLLTSGQVSVSTTAELCGFSNIYYFSKYFKEATGHTPSYYIENEI